MLLTKKEITNKSLIMRSAIPAFLVSWSTSSPVKIYNLVQADRRARESKNLLYMY